MRLRYSLGVFLLTLGTLGGLIGGYLRYRYHYPHGNWHERESTTPKGSEFKLYVMWLHRGDLRQLRYVLIIPRNVSNYTLSVGGSVGTKPVPTGIDVSAFALYLDGEEVPTGDDRIIYIYTAARTMRAATGLTPEELQQIRSINEGLDLTQLDVWDAKVAPLIDEEYAKAVTVRLKNLYGDRWHQFLP